MIHDQLRDGRCAREESRITADYLVIIDYTRILMQIIWRDVELPL
jgi:hypothetical protein